MSNENPGAIVPITQSAIVASGETSAHAQSAREIARVQAQVAMARRFPRDHMDFRTKLLRRCEDSSFAQVARYSVPRGGKAIEGPSIRFVEEAIRQYTNVDVTTDVISDDAEKRVLRIAVSDLEANVSHAVSITISKTMERKKLQEGDRPISQRRNSFGDIVYLLPATDDEIAVRQAALVSKSVRTQGLRILPGEVVEEAQDAIVELLKKRIEQDPNEERKRLADAFAKLGVMPSAVAEYIGGPLDAATPADLLELRAVFVALKDGQASWKSLLDAKRPPAPDAPKPSPDVEKARAEAKATIEKARKVVEARAKGKAPPVAQDGAKEAPPNQDAAQAAPAPEAPPTPKPDPRGVPGVDFPADDVLPPKEGAS